MKLKILSVFGTRPEAYRRLLVSDARSVRINVCSGRSVALLSVLDTMVEIAGHRPRIKVDPAFVRKDEVKELCGDPSLLFESIGLIEPTPIQSLLQSMYDSLYSSEADFACLKT